MYGPIDRSNLPATSVFRHGPQGAGVVDGEIAERPQHEFTEERENARESKVRAQLKRKRMCNSRRLPARDDAAFLSTDRMSAQFVGLPTQARTRIDDSIFHECWSIYLGGYSPAWRQWVGTPFRSNRKADRKTYHIDAFGDVITVVPLSGDAWRTRHDSFKWALHEQSVWCNYRLGMEPANLFLPFISQSDTFMATPARKRQGMVPDLIDIRRRVLMDVKTVHYGKIYRPIRFKAAARCETVKFRADRVHTDMVRKARQIDREHNNWADDRTDPGPVTRALMGYDHIEGLAVGAHGECSPDIHLLVERMARRGAQRRYKSMGFRSAREAKSTILAQVRLSLGVEGIRGVAEVRLKNLGTVLAGPASTSAAAGRRAQAQARFREQNDAHWARQAYREPR